jgi:A/G-specific adenine glycosylase
VRRPDARVVRRFQRRLLAWYAHHRRDLPWRRTRDPYRVLVSEVMLQQTQVERVVPKYREFLRHYPTLQDLAAAHVADVRRLWYPLGYNARPVRLHRLACEAMARYGGRLPDTRPALEALPGIGRYTAAAVLAFAYGRDEPVLDTNVRRVLGRVFLGRRRLARARGTPALWQLAAALLPPGRAYDFNQALMDFGATWCTARAPRCAPCPLRGGVCLYMGAPGAPKPPGRLRAPRPSRGAPRSRAQGAPGAPKPPGRLRAPRPSRGAPRSRAQGAPGAGLRQSPTR